MGGGLFLLHSLARATTTAVMKRWGKFVGALSRANKFRTPGPGVLLDPYLVLPDPVYATPPQGAPKFVGARLRANKFPGVAENRHFRWRSFEV